MSAKCEMEAQAAMQPAWREQAELTPLRVRRPQVCDDTRISGRRADQLEFQPCRNGVAEEQHRHPEAECDAQQLKRRQAKGPPLIDAAQGENKVQRCGAVEQKR